MNLGPEEQLLLTLIDQGAVEFKGFDEEGEALYSFTHKLQEVHPELYALHTSMLNKEMMHLWENGFVEMDLFSDNPVVTLSPEAFNPAKVDQLDEDMKKFLLEIKRIILS